MNQNGLPVQPPNHAAGYIILNFVFSYTLLSARGLKNIYKIDHNVSPREDLSKYGDEAVRSGKISRQTLELIKRNEAVHANAIENFPLFVGSILWACLQGAPAEEVNQCALAYTIVRLAYAAVYLGGQSLAISYVRSLLWWAGNFTCFRLLWN